MKIKTLILTTLLLPVLAACDPSETDGMSTNDADMMETESETETGSVNAQDRDRDRDQG